MSICLLNPRSYFACLAYVSIHIVLKQWSELTTVCIWSLICNIQQLVASVPSYCSELVTGRSRPELGWASFWWSEDFWCLFKLGLRFILPTSHNSSLFLCLKVPRFKDSRITVFVAAILFTAVIFDWEITVCQVLFMYMYVYMHALASGGRDWRTLFQLTIALPSRNNALIRLTSKIRLGSYTINF